MELCSVMIDVQGVMKWKSVRFGQYT